MTNLLTIFKKKLASLSRGTAGPEPGRDWLILLAVTLLVIGVSVLSNIGLFARIADGDLSPGEVGTNVLKTYPAGAIAELFESRAQMEAAYRSSFPFVDPSR